MDEANDCKTENAGAGGEVREADGVADNSGEEDFPGPVVSPVPRVA